MRLFLVLLFLGNSFQAAFAGGPHSNLGPECYLKTDVLEVEGDCTLNIETKLDVSTFVFTWENGKTTTLVRSKNQSMLNGIPAKSKFVDANGTLISLGNCYRTSNLKILFCASVLGLY